MKTAIEILINRIKVAVKDLQHYSFSEFQKLLPEYIHKNIGYSLLDSLFSKEIRVSIKEYFNRAKFERADELFNYYHLNPTEVAFQLGYKNPNSLTKSIKKNPVGPHVRFARYKSLKTPLTEQTVLPELSL